MRKVKIGKLAVVVLAAVTVLGIIYVFGSNTSINSVISDPGGDTKNENSIYDTSTMLTMLDEGKFDEKTLDAMYMSKEEFREVLKKVDEANKLIENYITYEYYAEEWMKLGENEDGSEKWGWKKGFKKETIKVTNEPLEGPRPAYWQPIYCLTAMAAMYQNDKWTDVKNPVKDEYIVQERIDEKTLDNVIRVFNYEYDYLFDGARTEKTFYKWAELESICYRYEEVGDWEVDSYPPGEYHIRWQKKIPSSCVTNICNAMQRWEYRFCKNTHCTPRYQKPDNWEVEYRIYDIDPDLFTRACQLVAPNFEWEYFLEMLDTLPGTEDTIDKETGEIVKGLHTMYSEYYEWYKENKTFIEEQRDFPEVGVIVGEELTYIIDHLYLDFEPWDGEEFTSPLETYSRISSEYGYRMHPTLNTWMNHEGMDFAAPEGTEIHSVLTGTVVVANYSNTAGNYVVVDHGNGLKTVYMHAQSLKVAVGQTVSKGETIAYVGSTGRSTGPHLHFGVSINGKYVNPANYI